MRGSIAKGVHGRDALWGISQVTINMSCNLRTRDFLRCLNRQRWGIGLQARAGDGAHQEFMDFDHRQKMIGETGAV
jgi:hypothetical protein